MDEKILRIRARVKGRVQGVYYRANTVKVARRLGLEGWVRNLPDGDVEFVAEGPAQKVEELVAWSRGGPPAARVDSVEVTEEMPTGDHSGFTIR